LTACGTGQGRGRAYLYFLVIFFIDNIDGLFHVPQHEVAVAVVGLADGWCC
jgi:hypothetical protein